MTGPDVPADPGLTCGCGIPPEGAPGSGQGCSAGCMMPVPTAYDMPTEAVQAGAVGLEGQGVPAEDFARLVFAAAAEAGWVLVPGPVRTEWATGRPGTPWEPTIWADEAAARRVQHSDTVVFRQVTDWRPAPEPTQDGDHS